MLTSSTEVAIDDAELATADMSHAFDVPFCGGKDDDGLGGTPTGRMSMTLETLLLQIGHNLTAREHPVQQHMCEQLRRTCIPGPHKNLGLTVIEANQQNTQISTVPTIPRGTNK